MEEGAFYPEVTYVEPGDTVTFLNNTDLPEEATSGLETWKSGELAVNESYLLTVTADTKLTFSYASDPEKAGALSFDLPPLGDVTADDILIGEGDGTEVIN